MDMEFFADFLFSQNQEFWAFKGPFSGEKQKDMADDGTSHVIMFCTLKQLLAISVDEI